MSALPPDVRALIDAIAAAAGDDSRRWRNPADGSVMIRIPGGVGRLGGRKRSLGEVSLGAFSLARHPITNAQFAAFIDGTGYAPSVDHPDNDRYLTHWTLSSSGRRRPPEALAEHPVVFVSWIDALHYCAWAGLTLPSEWCWERAAGGLKGRPYPWGGNRPHPRRNTHANLFGEATEPVGSYPDTRSAYGCQDMIGNVSEWCAPADDVAALPAPLPPPAPADAPALVPVRGSAFMRLSTREGRMTTAHRRSLSATRRNRWTGFRPAARDPVE